VSGIVWLECVGAFHVHTSYSDGGGAALEVIAAARDCGLDFLVIADHDTAAALREGWQGRHLGVEVLVAPEVSPRKRGHVIAMRTGRCAGYALSPSDDTLDSILSQGGYAIVAHPQGKHRPGLTIMQKPWYHWEHPCVRGLEIWSYMHDWVDSVAWWRFPQAHTVCNFPERVVGGPERTILKKWDDLGRVRRYAGIGGLDCHASRIPFAGVTIFPYEQMFRYLRNHFFIRADTPPSTAREALWEALAEGRGFIAHDVLADTAGARCVARLPDGRELMMGQEHPFVWGTEMILRLPRSGEIRWLADGEARLTHTGDELNATPVAPGVYRFEVRLQGRPWIFTNPFYLR